MINHFYYDMDGVLADFVGGICKLHGKPNPYLDSGNYGQWAVDRLMGLSSADFWEPTGYDFWYGLEVTEEAHKLLEVTRPLDIYHNVITHPSEYRYNECCTAKHDWLIEKLGANYFTDVWFTENKAQYASPGAFLIDDRDINVYRFKQAGGHAFLLPRPWNSGWARESTMIRDLKAELQRCLNT